MHLFFGSQRCGPNGRMTRMRKDRRRKSSRRRRRRRRRRRKRKTQGSSHHPSPQEGPPHQPREGDRGEGQSQRPRSSEPRAQPQEEGQERTPRHKFQEDRGQGGADPEATRLAAPWVQAEDPAGLGDLRRGRVQLYLGQVAQALRRVHRPRRQGAAGLLQGALLPVYYVGVLGQRRRSAGCRQMPRWLGRLSAARQGEAAGDLYGERGRQGPV